MGVMGADGETGGKASRAEEVEEGGRSQRDAFENEGKRDEEGRTLQLRTVVVIPERDSSIGST